MANDGTGALLSVSLSLLLSQVRSSLFYLSTVCHTSQFFSCRPERRVRASDLLLLLNLLLNPPHCLRLLLDKQCVRPWRQAECEVRRPCRPSLPLCGWPTDLVAEQHLLCQPGLEACSAVTKTTVVNWLKWKWKSLCPKESDFEKEIFWPVLRNILHEGKRYLQGKPPLEKSKGSHTSPLRSAKPKTIAWRKYFPEELIFLADISIVKHSLAVICSLARNKALMSLEFLSLQYLSILSHRNCWIICKRGCWWEWW